MQPVNESIHIVAMIRRIDGGLENMIVEMHTIAQRRDRGIVTRSESGECAVSGDADECMQKMGETLIAMYASFDREGNPSRRASIAAAVQGVPGHGKARYPRLGNFSQLYMDEGQLWEVRSFIRRNFGLLPWGNENE